MDQEQPIQSSEINFRSFHECVRADDDSNNQDYILFSIEELSNGPSDDYILIESEHHGSTSILEAGYMTVRPKKLDREKVEEKLIDLDAELLTDEEWEKFVEGYNNAVESTFSSGLYESNMMLVRNEIFTYVENLTRFFNHYIISNTSLTFDEEYLDKIGQAVEFANDWKELQKPISQQNVFGKYRVVPETLDNVKYVKFCNIGATLEFETFEDWEFDTLRYMHQSILSNKDMAAMKALQDNNYTRSEMCEKLGKSTKEIHNLQSKLELQISKLTWSQEEWDL